jgi:hypothetical protein
MNTLYGYSTSEHEYSVSVPALCRGDSEVRIYLSAHGGGTVGESYAGNGWDYLVTDDGRAVLDGADLRSPAGRPAGHAEMARALASFLSAAGESLALYGDDPAEPDYSPGQAEWLAANYERLSLFADVV